MTEKQVHEVDCIIYATGFKSTEFLASIEITGKNRISLKEKWKNGAEAYLGVTVPGFPNFFILYGPNTNLGHNSIVFMIEQQVEYFMKCRKEIMNSSHRYIDLRPGALEDWVEECQSSLKKTVWNKGCHSWYKTGDGKITNNWPYSTLEYQSRMSQVNFDHYRFA